MSATDHLELMKVSTLLEEFRHSKPPVSARSCAAQVIKLVLEAEQKAKRCEEWRIPPKVLKAFDELGWPVSDVEVPEGHPYLRRVEIDDGAGNPVVTLATDPMQFVWIVVHVTKMSTHQIGHIMKAFEKLSRGQE
ncbi:hypothetical protein CcrC1_gp429 [Caulobacter phage C1]|nr:hypothetical protein CcrC1_gp429 [Caulobacter phage C1]UTU08658.1 hypothetical protein CcrC2_gp430 [Caulobacter phage C2]UTU09171.1 hypothetical protein CcrJ4_gp424 [Caulobacter phage J4]UTU10290.1 hypothetical protein CcrRB23_gp428 [Caulobacter phage RB23]WGN97324.1 hypothetical protein [Bertelyvirus sp.]